MPSRCTCILAFALITGTTHAAFADCGPLIAALEKADREPRFAQYDVNDRNAPVAGKPMLARIGTQTYVMGLPSESTGNPLLTALRAPASKTGARCDEPVADTARGVKASRISFVNPIAPKSMSRVTVWIDTDSGLPVYHEIKGLRTGGFAWAYASAVREPDAGWQAAAARADK